MKVLIFLSFFIFNLQFLYELKRMIHLSETLWDFPFSIFVFIKLHIFIEQKAWTL